jgi:hypothetical protein
MLRLSLVILGAIKLVSGARDMLLYPINQVPNGGERQMIDERELDANRFSGIDCEAEPE